MAVPYTQFQADTDSTLTKKVNSLFERATEEHYKDS